MDLHGENQLFFGRVTAGDDEALGFINVAALPALLDTTEIHMDATFQPKPRGFYQLATLQAMSFGNVSSDKSSFVIYFICYFLFIHMNVLLLYIIFPGYFNCRMPDDGKISTTVRSLSPIGGHCLPTDDWSHPSTNNISG